MTNFEITKFEIGGDKARNDKVWTISLTQLERHVFFEWPIMSPKQICLTLYAELCSPPKKFQTLYPISIFLLNEVICLNNCDGNAVKMFHKWTLSGFLQKIGKSRSQLWSKLHQTVFQKCHLLLIGCDLSILQEVIGDNLQIPFVSEEMPISVILNAICRKRGA